MLKPQRENTPLPQDLLLSGIRHFSISSRWVAEDDCRFDATTYNQSAVLAVEAIESCRLFKRTVGDLCGTIWHPVQNQARSNFKRIYTKKEHGTPFVSSRDMFFFPLRPHRFLSNRIPKLKDLRVPRGWLLVSRSGTIGNVLFVNERLAACAITDHAIRIEPSEVPAGYLYAFLSSSIGQPLIAKGGYGATVEELEPKHIASIPVPLALQSVQESIHDKIVRAYELRDEGNNLLEEADQHLHAILGVAPFDESDIEYLDKSDGAARVFTILSSELGGRFDASHHIPIARSVIHKLNAGRFPLVNLREICRKITIPARFKRSYVAVGQGVPYLLPSHLPLMRPYGMKAISNSQAQSSPQLMLKEGELLLTTDGTIGRIHPVTQRMKAWFGSNNMARLWDEETDMGFLYAFLTTPFGVHQIGKDIYGGVIDHINEFHIESAKIPNVPPHLQSGVGDLVRAAFAKKDEANALEDEAIAQIEAIIQGN